jgi:glycine C-acetyltransferase
LARLGFNTGSSETPITPILVGEADLAMRFSDRLFERGVFAQGIGYPTVAKGKARLRTIVTATHSDEDLDQALTILGEVGRTLGVVS